MSSGFRGIGKLSGVSPGKGTRVLASMDELTDVKCEAMGGTSGDEGAGGVRDNEEVGPLTGEERKASGTEDGILYRVVGSRGRAVGAAAVGLAAATQGVRAAGLPEDCLGEEHAR